ncbi:hypothetical protein [Streptomyces halobius]|uniref:Uncharacterized protein n=1 Tax=Streptomyces halobius TaxID=2879846 RepID=A0ABY4MJC7_9ACTN|nr:hypothetical protein [Streptomyces halobius]UQA97322.1 hypothetical protein K9S39_40565 [Streptomyces halobius]
MEWLLERWAGRPRLDWLITLVVTGAHLSVVRVTGSGDILAWPHHEQRIDIYTTTATVAALVGSFITAAVAQYAASNGPRMRALRTHEVQGVQFRRNWVGILSATLVISGLCLMATILDTTESDPGGVHWLVEVAMCLGGVRAVRLLWLFGKVIVAADRDLGDERT